MADEQNNSGAGKGTDPSNNGSNQNPTPFDVSKIGDEDFNKILEDPRLWKTKTLQELKQSQKELKDIKTKQAQDEAKRLEEQGEFKKLADQRESERLQAVERADKLALNMQIMAEASKKGITDLDAATKLVDSGSIKKDDNGNFVGVTEAIDQLIKTRPYLTNSQQSVGNPSNPGAPQQPPDTFTIDQIANPDFYNKNHEAIKRAVSAGRIVDNRIAPGAK